MNNVLKHTLILTRTNSKRIPKITTSNCAFPVFESFVNETHYYIFNQLYNRTGNGCEGIFSPKCSIYDWIFMIESVLNHSFNPSFLLIFDDDVLLCDKIFEFVYNITNKKEIVQYWKLIFFSNGEHGYLLRMDFVPTLLKNVFHILHNKITHNTINQMDALDAFIISQHINYNSLVTGIYETSIRMMHHPSTDPSIEGHHIGNDLICHGRAYMWTQLRLYSINVFNNNGENNIISSAEANYNILINTPWKPYAYFRWFGFRGYNFNSNDMKNRFDELQIIPLNLSLNKQNISISLSIPKNYAQAIDNVSNNSLTLYLNHSLTVKKDSLNIVVNIDNKINQLNMNDPNAIINYLTILRRGHSLMLFDNNMDNIALFLHSLDASHLRGKNLQTFFVNDTKYLNIDWYLQKYYNLYINFNSTFTSYHVLQKIDLLYIKCTIDKHDIVKNIINGMDKLLQTKLIQRILIHYTDINNHPLKGKDIDKFFETNKKLLHFYLVDYVVINKQTMTYFISYHKI